MNLTQVQPKPFIFRELTGVGLLATLLVCVCHFNSPASSIDFFQQYKVSYSFCLLHYGVAINYLANGIELLLFFALVLCSVAVYKFIEKPLSIQIRKVLR